jgi:hypothetical protein
MSPEGRNLCWKCGTEYAPEVTVCVKCGINLDTGEEMKTRTGDQARDPTAREKTLGVIGEWMPGLVRPGVVALSIVVGLCGLAVMAFAFGLLGFRQYINMATTILLGGPGLVLYAHAAAWMISGRIVWLHEALAEFAGRNWALFFSLLTLAFVILGGIARAGA